MPRSNPPRYRLVLVIRYAIGMEELQTALDDLLPNPVRVVDVCSVGGGCISDAMCVALDDQGVERRVFVKRNVASFLDNFQCEADGCAELIEAKAIGVSKPLAVGLAVGHAWLVADWINQSVPGAGFFEKFGLQLAKLHRDTRGNLIGWDRDNFLGAAKQFNQSCSTWADFFAYQRIELQLRWAVDQSSADDALCQDCQRIIRNMADLLDGREDGTSLLHGDLWSGNYLCDASGDPVLIDPAVYRGCREAEFGMLKLFGSCPPNFYQSYQDAWPMNDGWERRVSIYVLYHLLNHLNLFGRGYLAECKQTAAAILLR